MNYDWNFSRLVPYVGAFVHGTETTLALTGVVVVVGSIVGVPLGFGLRRRSLGIVLYPLVDVIRAVPPLVIILFTYFVMTVQVIGFAVPSFWVAAIALSVNLAAFTGDLVRAAIGNVPAATLDAGLALGMSSQQLRRRLVLPHVWREVLPAMTALYIGMLKATSLAAVINVREVVFAAQTVIADVSRSLEAWTIVGLIYVALVVPATYMSRWIEKWASRGRH